MAQGSSARRHGLSLPEVQAGCHREAEWPGSLPCVKLPALVLRRALPTAWSSAATPNEATRPATRVSEWCEAWTVCGVSKRRTALGTDASAASASKPRRGADRQQPDGRGCARRARAHGAGAIAGILRIVEGRRHALVRGTRLGRQGDDERERGLVAKDAGRLRRTHRLGRTIVPREVTAVRTRRGASAATGYVVAIARAATRRSTLARGRGAGAVTAAIGRRGVAAAVLDGGTALLCAQAAATVVARGVLIGAALRRGGRGHCQHGEDGPEPGLGHRSLQ